MDNVVFSNFVSARSLRIGLERLGESLEAYCSPGFMVPTRDREPQAGDRLLFTDEDSLARHLGREEFRFYPSKLSFAPDDKLALARRLETIGADPVPFRSLDEDAAELGFPLVLKCRHSWRAGRALPRGAICHSISDITRALEEFVIAGLEPDVFFLQKYLPDGIENSLSVSGFFDSRDPERTLMLVTNKVASAHHALGHALAVRVLPDHEALRDRASRVLSALEYVGPFELEFLRDVQADHLHELELNPRFWLQHSLFVHVYDNALLERYLDRTSLSFPDLGQQAIWVSGVGLIIALATPWRPENWKLWRAMRAARKGGHAVVIDPPATTAIRIVLQETGRRIRRLKH
ncbi:MAG: hypothetical protein QNJ73_00510 [Gammaproteobacteria bacterium]|nr:hypothetical protein [Gammaproteobacteria bacterium]